MSHIAEHYSRARHTSNLKSEPRTRMSAADVLGAAGMAAQSHADAMLLWSVCYGGKTGQKLALVETLAHQLTGKMLQHGWKGKSRIIAMAVLAYYLHAKCSACDGVGYQIVPDTITRSDDLCPACDGRGKPQKPVNPAFDWLLLYVETLISVAAGRQMAKLAADMDL